MCTYICYKHTQCATLIYIFHFPAYQGEVMNKTLGISSYQARGCFFFYTKLIKIRKSNFTCNFVNRIINISAKYRFCIFLRLATKMVHGASVHPNTYKMCKCRKRIWSFSGLYQIIAVLRLDTFRTGVRNLKLKRNRYTW